MQLSRLIKGLVAGALTNSGVPALLRALLWRGRTAILLYHDPDPETLGQHLAFLKRICTVVSLDELLAVIEGQVVPLGRSAVITIDDGHAGNAKLAEVFHRYGVRPTIYLCSQIVGTDRMFWWQHPEAIRQGAEQLKRLPNWERLRVLSRGGFAQDEPARPHTALNAEDLQRLGRVADLKSHGRYHPILTKCDDAQCRDEIEGSKREIEALTGMICCDFAYPNGDYGAREIAFLKSAGYRSARTCDAGWNGPGTDSFRLRCLPIADDASLGWFSLQLTGIPTYLRYLVKGSFTGRARQS